jgi:GAF domain-containing protein
LPLNVELERRDLTKTPHFTSHYKVGGHLPLGFPSYVVREADSQLYEALKLGEFCYVFNSRQMGKTSLRVRAMHQLQQEGFACAAIDLTKIGSHDITPEQWYAGIILRLATRFSLPIDVQDWLRDREYLSPVQRLSEVIEQVLLESVREKIVIFIDEIDSILSLNFRTDDFFAFIRSCHGDDRLTFALLGVTTPTDLIQDPKSTPFNLGLAIELNGFQLDEVQPLVQGLDGIACDPEATIAAILDWTGGQPFLTQKICQSILRESVDSVPDSDRFFRLCSEDFIQQYIQDKIIKNWESRDEPPHLRTVRDRILHSGENTLPILKLYQNILQNGGVDLDDSPEQIALRLSGLAIKKFDQLQVFNQIYAAVFDWEWLTKAIADRQPDFLQIVAKQEQKLLSMLNVMDGKSFDDVLYEILGAVTLKMAEDLSVDRATVFLIDEEKHEIWSIIARNQKGGSPHVEISGDKAIVGLVTTLKEMVNIPFYFADTLNPDWQSEDDLDYPTYTLLALPLIDEQENLVAVVQLLNKLKQPHYPELPLIERIDKAGFIELDRLKFFEEYAPALLRILERCQSSYKLTLRLVASEALTEATRSLSQSSLDSEEIIDRVMEAAKKLMNADRSTLWLIDHQNQQLWTKITAKDSSVMELRVQIGEGYAGTVAQMGEPINIPFDLYNDLRSETAKKTDQKTGYRTCSLLCMPVWSPEGQLLGVTQLVNKRKPGEFPEYNPEDWPQAPDCFQANFDAQSQKYMQIFNDQVGVALSNAQKYETAKQQAELHPQNFVSQTLAMLSQVMEGQGFDDILDTTLQSIALKLGKSLKADRTSIFLLDEEKQEFWSIVAENEGEHSLEIRLPANRGIVGEVARTRQTINIPFDLYDDPRSEAAKAQDRKTGYRTYSMLSIPLLNDQNQLIAVVQLINKLQSNSLSIIPLSERIDRLGFTDSDEQQFYENASLVKMILESFRSYHKTARGQRVAAALMAATRSVSQESLELDEVLQRVMLAAKKLMNADRSTLWLIDRQNQQLWTKITFFDGTSHEIRVQMGEGYVGKVATTGHPIVIPFDLYDHPDSETAKKTDRKTGYRTCSLLCMPVWSPDSDLIGVTQLINKKKSKELYDNTEELQLCLEGKVPQNWQTSFDESDCKYMQIFNNQVGVILQNTELLEAVRRQEQNLRDSLSQSPTGK